MGHSKNRKKRRSGRIYKQAVYVDPMIPYVHFSCRSESVFDIWCGFDKWCGYAEIEGYEAYDEQDEKELEFITVPDSSRSRRVEFPNATKYGSLRRYARLLKPYLEFDDSKIKGRHYHSHKTTYFRKKRILGFVKWYMGMIEEQYAEILKTEPEKIENWVKEVVEKGRRYCEQNQE